MGNGTIPVAPRWPPKVTQLSTGPVERWQFLEERERDRQTYIKQPFDLRAGQLLSECPCRALSSEGDRWLGDPCLASFHHPPSVHSVAGFSGA